MKTILLLLPLLLVAACSTPKKQTFDLTTLKDTERAYTGTIQVDLNGKKNADLTCDLFMNSDLAATIRLAEDGVYVFKTTKKTLAFTRIACLHTALKKQRWIYQTLDLARIKQPGDAQAKELHNMGSLDIKWIVKDSEFEQGADVMGAKDPMASVGKIEVTLTPPTPIAPVKK